MVITTVLKIQRPVASNQKHPPMLVYDRNRTIQFETHQFELIKAFTGPESVMDAKYYALCDVDTEADPVPHITIKKVCPLKEHNGVW